MADVAAPADSESFGADADTDANADGNKEALDKIVGEEMEFQTFDDDFYEDDAAASETAPLTGSASTAAGPKPDRKAVQAAARIWNVEYYQCYFDVDTDDVTERLRASALPFKGKTLFDSNPEADLYGPFWISATLSLCLFVVSNLASFFSFVPSANGAHPQRWEYDFTLLASGFTTTFGYVLGMATLVWLASKWISLPMKLVDLVCIYGYSFTVMVPLSVLFVVPSNVFRWLLVAAAFGYSGYGLVKTMQIHCRLDTQDEEDQKKGKSMLAGIFLLHCAFGLVFKLFFFKAFYSEAPL